MNEKTKLDYKKHFLSHLGPRVVPRRPIGPLHEDVDCLSRRPLRDGGLEKETEEGKRRKR